MWSPCLSNLYAENIIPKAGLNESQTEIKIAGRNINNLRYVDDTTLMAESEEELKEVKEVSGKAGLNLNIKELRSWHRSHHFKANRRGNSGSSSIFYFLGPQNHCGW